MLACISVAAGCATDAQVVTHGATSDEPFTTLVSCDEAIDGQNRTPAGRIVLERVGFPADGYDYDITRLADGTQFTKFGLYVRGGAEPVRILVPDDLRGQVEIGWGSGAEADILEFEPCSPANRWKVFAGGVYLQTSGCVPLTVETSGRRETIELGIGRPCS